MADATSKLEIIKTERVAHAQLSVKISQDKMTAYMDVVFMPGPKSKINREAIHTPLKNLFAEDFLNHLMIDAITAAINSGRPMQDKKVASGRPMLDGEDGKFEQIIKLVEIPQNDQDTRYVRSIMPVVPGTILGIIHPPKEGNEGMDLFGNAHKGKLGQPFKLNFDSRTVSLRTTQNAGGLAYLVARAHGFFLSDQGRFRIQPVLHISRDVDMTSGNISCNCAVEIGGEVAKGSTVSARDDLYIKGGCQSSPLSSRLGFIRVDGLVVGGPGAYVKTAGSIRIYMTQYLNMICDGDIVIGKDARDSTLEALGCILMKQGHLFGGTATALGGVEAAIIGSEGETLTVVGTPPRAVIEADLAKLQSELTALETAEQEMLKKAGSLCNPDGQILPVLDAVQCRKINEAAMKLEEFKISREILQRKIARMQTAVDTKPWFQLNFLQVLHKGVVIIIGEDRFVVDNYMTGPATIEYHHETHEFKKVKYRELPAAKAMKKSGHAP